MAQSLAQQVINQPLALLTYPAQPTPMQQYHITPVLPDSVHKPEQDMLNSVPAQLTTVKTPQEEATQRISHLETVSRRSKWRQPGPSVSIKRFSSTSQTKWLVGTPG